MRDFGAYRSGGETYSSGGEMLGLLGGSEVNDERGEG